MRRRNERARLALVARDADMMAMTQVRSLMLASATMMVMTAGAALAQLAPGPLPSTLPPPPAPPPPPVATVPAVPKLVDPPPLTHETIQPAPDGPRAQVRQRSYDKRIADCMNDATAAQLSAAERPHYARRCANLR
jgi:hypothetical protein